MAATEKNAEELRKASQLSHVPRELCDARFRARAWAHQYNHFFPTGAEANATSLQQTRAQMLREILGRVDGDDVVIEPPFNIDYGCNISIGERFYANFNLVILDCAIVTIGNRVMMGPNVSIFAATHETEVASRRDNIEYARPVSIGDDCWIGGHVVVLPGVTIGKGCVIAAGSIVTKEVPAWSVAKGVPARVFKSVEPIE
ncbi:Galactoside o-acetyltransferase [Diaporthe amygdali]|uniref:Galactoside o-acetyltransferase n=1 Tax=Phomopsis amygdali TaxID=1214568 RepID=UPI0022FE14C6|nr:Galactoside o-acetyltransferase [Diaporthe amygdali]KAJ0123651.1 Galactoside o-acetyltransferase [Diaporthe amygdali]